MLTYTSNINTSTIITFSHNWNIHHHHHHHHHHHNQHCLNTTRLAVLRWCWLWQTAPSPSSPPHTPGTSRWLTTGAVFVMLNSSSSRKLKLSERSRSVGCMTSYCIFIGPACHTTSPLAMPCRMASTSTLLGHWNECLIKINTNVPPKILLKISLCVCVCACAHLCVCVCMCMNMFWVSYACLIFWHLYLFSMCHMERCSRNKSSLPQVCIYVCVCVCMLACVCMHVPACLYACMYMCVHACMCVCVCICVCVHVCMYVIQTEREREREREIAFVRMYTCGSVICVCIRVLYAHAHVSVFMCTCACLPMSMHMCMTVYLSIVSMFICVCTSTSLTCKVTLLASVKVEQCRYINSSQG